MFVSLAGKSNAQVAAYYQMLFGTRGDKREAQVLATALAVYVTNQGLAGGAFAAAYGFVVTAEGTGVATVSVGSDGAAVGRTNGSVATVMDLLLAVDRKATRTPTSIGFVLYGSDARGRNLALDFFGDLNAFGEIA
jgi:hypothetical protein